jgi:hypothetical protein
LFLASMYHDLHCFLDGIYCGVHLGLLSFDLCLLWPSSVSNQPL